jgi:hypothetical protein
MPSKKTVVRSFIVPPGFFGWRASSPILEADVAA